MFKKFVVIFLAFLLVLPVAIPDVSAQGSKDYINVRNKNLSNQEVDLVKLLKKEEKNNLKDNKKVDKILKNKFKSSQKDIDQTMEKLKKSSPFPEISVEELNSMEELDFEKYLNKNIKDGKFRVEPINEEINIIFTNSDMFFIETYNLEGDLTLEDESELGIVTSLINRVNSLNEPQSALAATYYSGTVSHKYTAYSWVGLPLWDIWTKGEFKYNKSTYVEPFFYDGDVNKRFTGWIWQIDNYAEGTTRAADQSWATVYTRANFHYGIEYSGVGVVVQYIKVKAQIKCSKYGTITRSTLFD